jgi:hypothetical protein
MLLSNNRAFSRRADNARYANRSHARRRVQRDSSVSWFSPLFLLLRKLGQPTRVQPHVDKHRQADEPVLKPLSRRPDLAPQLLLGHEREQLLLRPMTTTAQQTDKMLTEPVEVLRFGLPIQQLYSPILVGPRHFIAQRSRATHVQADDTERKGQRREPAADDV